MWTHTHILFNSLCVCIYIYIYIYILHKIRERKRKTLTKNWRDLWRKGTHKHMKTYSKYFDGHRYFSQSEESEYMWTHDKDRVCGAVVFTMCSHTSTLFWLRKTSVIVKTFQLSFHTFVCLSSRDLLTFLVRVSTFFSYSLCYPYFDTFLSRWPHLYVMHLYIICCYKY